MKECSPPFFGNDEEINGDTVCLACRLIGIGFDSAWLNSIWDDASDRKKCMELLLLICARDCSGLSSLRFLEKNDAFEAVMGVLGVFGCTCLGGGVLRSSAPAASCRAATLDAVGVLKGSKFKGGSRSGCRFFFLTGVELFWCSKSELAFLLGFGSLSFLGTSRIEFRPDKLFVEVLFILLESKGKLDFRLLKNGGSAGESFGDSYALGIAGTGEHLPRHHYSHSSYVGFEVSV